MIGGVLIIIETSSLASSRGILALQTAMGQEEEVSEQVKCWNQVGGNVLQGPERRREAKAALYELRSYDARKRCPA